MSCPHCAATATVEQRRRTALGYRTYRCRACRRLFNERSGTPYNHLQNPTDVVLLVVLWRLRYKLSLRDLAEMLLVRGFAFSREAVRDWEARFAPLSWPFCPLEARSWHAHTSTAREMDRMAQTANTPGRLPGDRRDGDAPRG